MHPHTHCQNNITSFSSFPCFLCLSLTSKKGRRQERGRGTGWMDCDLSYFNAAHRLRLLAFFGGNPPLESSCICRPLSPFVPSFSLSPVSLEHHSHMRTHARTHEHTHIHNTFVRPLRCGWRLFHSVLAWSLFRTHISSTPHSLGWNRGKEERRPLDSLTLTLLALQGKLGRGKYEWKWGTKGKRQNLPEPPTTDSPSSGSEPEEKPGSTKLCHEPPSRLRRKGMLPLFYFVSVFMVLQSKFQEWEEWAQVSKRSFRGQANEVPLYLGVPNGFPEVSSWVLDERMHSGGLHRI